MYSAADGPEGAGAGVGNLFSSLWSLLTITFISFTPPQY
jgi:hypothetical protein